MIRPDCRRSLQAIALWYEYIYGQECCSPEGVVVVTCWLSVTTGVVVVVVGVTVTVIGAPGSWTSVGSGGTLMDRARPAELSELSVTGW